MYQGHHQDGSGVQKHSAGSQYPYVIGRYHGGELPHFVMAPDGTKARFATGVAAVRFANEAAKHYTRISHACNPL